jgi:hypothetical protein
MKDGCLVVSQTVGLFTRLLSVTNISNDRASEYTTAFVSYPKAYNSCGTETTVLESLVYWFASAMGIPGGWRAPRVPEVRLQHPVPIYPGSRYVSPTARNGDDDLLFRMDFENSDDDDIDEDASDGLDTVAPPDLASPPSPVPSMPSVHSLASNSSWAGKDGSELTALHPC